MNTLGAVEQQTDRKVLIDVDRQGWLLVVIAALALAVVSWATNITTMSQISGEANEFTTFRLTISKLANSGTAWAGLAILSGWLVRRPLQSFVAGIVGSEFSLAAHYAMGRVSGMFDATTWAENRSWFVLGLLICGLLGLIGAAATRRGPWGLATRMVVPVGALLEPLVVDMLTPLKILPWPDRFSSVACGIIIITGGLAGGMAVIAASRRTYKQASTPSPSSQHHILLPADIGADQTRRKD